MQGNSNIKHITHSCQHEVVFTQGFESEYFTMLWVKYVITSTAFIAQHFQIFRH